MTGRFALGYLAKARLMTRGRRFRPLTGVGQNRINELLRRQVAVNLYVMHDHLRGNEDGAIRRDNMYLSVTL